MKKNIALCEYESGDDGKWLILSAGEIGVDDLVRVGRFLGVVKEE